ncbi:DUF1810 domain-containing protein [Phycicoccus endophyticus]|uniref:DUF1810 domain-containing protein n=1 Tax=Phycicoccus endophyticus TaxID=1690220 RepID=A0A7G9QYU1_9MICO|nr:DUF1810 domain-containing protein [Phycicoccus endophyticus]NHI20439.1 DUF1810 domain-containing protein [Phycicoccus endophyticus]QNN48516.1 DUF1810 domain-containing protein [Phycicoccus endophyticus]GGL30769.1 hypothetical protein GCM10012283_11410 [Phycicoccus endophyticus]
MVDQDVSRFVAAQDAGGTYAQALSELRAGHKRSHWMWFVLPQLAGLGRSPTARYYGVGGLVEARAYLAHPVLGPRLVECCEALLALDGDDPVAVLGGIDAVKLRSSMTLFARAAEGVEGGDAGPFRRVLEQYFGGEEDPATLVRLSG